METKNILCKRFNSGLEDTNIGNETDSFLNEVSIKQLII